VKLNVHSTEIEHQAALMLERFKQHAPSAVFTGFAVQPMAVKPKAYELILGITKDPSFGHVILFGQGGTAVEAIQDSAVTLVPLAHSEAAELIQSTRVYRLLKGYRNRPAVDFQALEAALVRLSWLPMLFPEVVELDINPLLVDENGVLAVDGRIKIA
jgi:acetyltransferase